MQKIKENLLTFIIKNQSKPTKQKSKIMKTFFLSNIKI